MFGGGIPGNNWEMQDCIVGRHMNSFSYVFLHCWAVPVPPFPPVSQQDLVVVTEVSGTERKAPMTVFSHCSRHKSFELTSVSYVYIYKYVYIYIRTNSLPCF